MQQVDLHQRLTPAHISLSAWDVETGKGNWKKVIEKQQDSKGTYCVANEKINQGEQLLVEEPFIRQLDAKYKNNHCHHCFKDLVDQKYKVCRDKDCKWNMKYCSDDCEQQAWTRSHQWLCRFPELSKEDADVIFAVEGYFVSKSQNKETIPNLVSNRELFDPNLVKDYRKKLEKVAASFYLTDRIIDCIITIIFQIKCNSFAVKTAESVPVDASFIVSREFLTLGRAVYLSASKLNHDCNPNSIVSFGDGGTKPCQLKIHCVNRPIEKGNEVTISYGPLASVHGRDDRLKKLKECYQFDCKCNSCKEKIEKKSPESIYKCQICKKGRLYRQQFKCSECDQEPNWSYFIRTENQIEIFKQRQDFVKVFQLQTDIYHDDVLVVGKTADRLAMYACNSGQWEAASNYAIMSLTVAQKVYGKLSVEAAEEMMKLSTILLNLCLTTGKRKREALAHIKSTIITYRILGLDKSAPEDIEELQEMSTHLTFLA